MMRLKFRLGLFDGNDMLCGGITTPSVIRTCAKSPCYICLNDTLDMFDFDEGKLVSLRGLSNGV
jgi:hypothetical protein